MYYCHNTLLPSVDVSLSEFFKSKGMWVSFLKVKVLKKGHFIFKIK